VYLQQYQQAPQVAPMSLQMNLHPLDLLQVYLRNGIPAIARTNYDSNSRPKPWPLLWNNRMLQFIFKTLWYSIDVLI
jgi:hypothetical protein